MSVKVGRRFALISSVVNGENSLDFFCCMALLDFPTLPGQYPFRLVIVSSRIDMVVQLNPNISFSPIVGKSRIKQNDECIV